MNTKAVRRLPLVLLILLSISLVLPVFAAEGGEEGNNLFAGDIGNAVWTLVIFVGLLLVLGKFAWGPILTSLQERESFIRGSLTQAKADREEAAAQLKAYEARLVEARTEATAIVEEGRRDAEAVKLKIEETAREEADKMIERAKREIGLAKETAVKDLYSRAGQLATDAASRIIRQEIKPQDHERLIEEAIARIERGDAGSFGVH